MTLEECRTSYPNSCTIIMSFERCQLHDTGWQDARDQGISPQRFVDKVRKTFMEKWEGEPDVTQEALDQIDHPDFLRYVAAKLGMM